MSEVNYTGVEVKVRASPTQSADEITQQVISQLAPYLRQVFGTYQVVYIGEIPPSPQCLGEVVR